MSSRLQYNSLSYFNRPKPPSACEICADISAVDTNDVVFSKELLPILSEKVDGELDVNEQNEAVDEEKAAQSSYQRALKIHQCMHVLEGAPSMLDKKYDDLGTQNQNLLDAVNDLKQSFSHMTDHLSKSLMYLEVEGCSETVNAEDHI